MKADRLNGTAKEFLLYAQSQSAPGSNAPPSYVTGGRRLDDILRWKTHLLRSGESLWENTDAERLDDIHKAALAAQDEGREGRGFFAGTVSPSYYLKHFYSAAVRKLPEFQLVHLRRTRMLAMAEMSDSTSTIAKELSAIPIEPRRLYWDDEIPSDSVIGKERLAEIKVRENQYVFRQMTLRNYGFKCCLCGPPVVETLCASHISEWSKDAANRLNPENGLCLTATYHATFDRHLVSLDEDYRLIVSPSLREYCTNQAFQTQFKALGGKRIEMPRRFKPSQEFLA